ncbi:MAG: hypothetical protein OXF65_11700 [Acidimicrobiaceae bacterium]|nr:hypothetical protein [Acidimicrobiaceae bacterium]
MDRPIRRHVANPLDRRERWMHTLGYALAMFAAYLLAPASFVAALTASTVVACLYLTTFSWRHRTPIRDAGRREPMTAGARPDIEDAPERPSFWREFPHAFVY